MKNKMKDDDLLSDAMDINPPPVPYVELPELPTPVLPKTEEDDKAYVRENTLLMIEIARFSIVNLAQLAASSQDAEHYAHLAGLLRAGAGLNKQLLEKLNTSKSESGDGEVNITHQNLFVGSTSELQAVLDAQQNKKTKSK